MRPLLNKDFRRLRWLLRQEPPRKVRDYLIREVVSLTKGGISPTALSPMRMALREEEMKMAHVISALCFVSRMRLRDQELTNGIHLGLQMSSILRRFFGSASLYGMTPIREADTRFCLGEVNRWYPGAGEDIPDDLIEQKIIEGFPNLCTHVRARVERLYAFFELPPDLSLPPAPQIRSIWEMPSPAASPPRPPRTPSYHQRPPGFRRETRL